MACMAGLAKLWMALSAQVLQKKNEKQSQTEGSLRKAIGCSWTCWAPMACWLALAGLPGTATLSSRKSRFSTMTMSTLAAQTAPHRQAMRHELVSVVMPAMNTGASPQPMLPDRPWTENAWPMRFCDTRLLRMVKSTGWNGALPRPAKQAAAISMP